MFTKYTCSIIRIGFSSVLFLFLFTILVSEAQVVTPRGAAPVVEIRNIELRFHEYNDRLGRGEAGSRTFSKGRWGKIDIEFATRRDWIDEVEFKCYVLLSNYGRRVMLTGSVTCVYVKQGARHYAALFIYPNAIERYGGRIEGIAVEAYYSDALVDFKTAHGRAVARRGEKWWHKYSGITGSIVNWMYTPLRRDGIEDYELVKVEH